MFFVRGERDLQLLGLCWIWLLLEMHLMWAHHHIFTKIFVVILPLLHQGKDCKRAI